MLRKAGPTSEIQKRCASRCGKQASYLNTCFYVSLLTSTLLYFLRQGLAKKLTTEASVAKRESCTNTVRLL